MAPQSSLAAKPKGYGNATARKNDINGNMKRPSSKDAGLKELLEEKIHNSFASIGFKIYAMFVYSVLFIRYSECIFGDIKETPESATGLASRYTEELLSSCILAILLGFQFGVSKGKSSSKELKTEEENQEGRNGDDIAAAMILLWDLITDCAVSVISYAAYLILIFNVLFKRYHELRLINATEQTIMFSRLPETAFFYVVLGFFVIRQHGFRMNEINVRHEALVKFYIVFTCVALWFFYCKSDFILFLLQKFM